MPSNLKPATSRVRGTPPHSFMAVPSCAVVSRHAAGLVHAQPYQPPRLRDAARVCYVKNDLHSPSGFPEAVVNTPVSGFMS